MQKSGTVHIQGRFDTDTLFCVWLTDDVKYERIDLYESIEDVDIVNTSKCLSSYYRDTKEYYFKDEALIRIFNKTIRKCKNIPAQAAQTFDMSGGNIILNSVKDDKNGNVYSVTIVNGNIAEEIFQTVDCVIKIESVNMAMNYEKPPINFVNYTMYGGDEFVVDDMYSYSGLDYYTLDQLKVMYPGKLDHIETYDYVVVDSLETAFERLQQFIDSKEEYVAVDIESTGLGVQMFGPDCITGVVLSFNEVQSTYYPFRQEGFKYNLPIWFMSEIAAAVNNKPPNVKVCTYNGKMEIESFWKERPYWLKYSEYAMTKWKYELYETRMVSVSEEYTPTEKEITLASHSRFAKEFMDTGTINTSISIRSDVDGFHISVKLDQRRGRGIHTLKTNATNITGLFWLELDLIFKGDIKFNVLPPDLVRYYACPDTCNTIRVCKVLEKKVPPCEVQVLNIEHELTYSKANNEFFGMRTDVEKRDALLEEKEYECDILEKRFKEIHKTSKNIRSNAVKVDIFYNRLKAPVLIRTKNGGPSASNAALKAILEDGTIPESKLPDKSKWPPDIMDKAREHVLIEGRKLISNRYPSLILLQSYNKARKELGAFKRIKKRSYRDRVYFYIMSDGADSDRQTSDAHQYSDAMKSIILSDSPDHYLISCDYSQVELRVLAYVYGEQELIDMQFNPNIDIHRAIIQRITGKEMWDISAEERKERKSTNFGVVYGMTEYGLVKRDCGPKYTKEQLLERRQAIMDFYNGLPKVKYGTEESKRLVMRDGYIQTKFGFRRFFPKVKDPAVTEGELSKIFKAANNTRIQGFAATLMKIAECNYASYIHEKGWDEVVDCDGVMLPKVRVMLSIHDEVLISTHKSVPIEEIIEMCKACQEISIKGSAPYFASPAFVDNWYLGKDPAYEIPIEFRDEIIEKYHKGISVLHMDTYLEDLNNFRNRRLINYLEGLYEKYKTAENMAKNCKDPDLTHVMISVYLPKNMKDKKDNHRECILKSIESYLEQRDEILAGAEYKVVGRIISDVQDNDTEEKATYMDDSVNINEYISYTDDGELIVEYDDDVVQDELEEDDESSIIDIRPEFVKKLEAEYAFYAMSQCFVDLTEYYSSSIGEKLHQALYKIAKENPGAYDVFYLINKSMVNAGYTIGYVPGVINDKFRDILVPVETDVG